MLTRYRRKLNAYVDWLAAGISFLPPNSITLANLAFALWAAVLYYARFIQLAGLVLLVSGGLDAIDGAVARMTGRVSRFGGFLDSTIDRVCDFAVLAGIALSYVVDWKLVMFTAFGSFMVPYCRARGEAAGSEGMAVGIAERAERQLIIILASFIHPVFRRINVLAGAVFITGLLAWVTTVQRVMAARKTLVD